MTVVKIQIQGQPDTLKSVTTDHAARIFTMQNDKSISDKSCWELVDNKESKKAAKKDKSEEVQNESSPHE